MAIFGAAITAVQVAQEAIKVISNNVANARTTGFKASELATSDLFYSNVKRAGTIENSEAARRPTGLQIGSGAKVDGTYRILTQGDFRNTNNPLDIAIIGPGYFPITLPNGKIGYTRDGAFKLDPDTRRLVTIRGEPLDTNITIPDTVVDLNTVSIDSSGILTALDANNVTVLSVQLELFSFPNENGLEAGGNNMLFQTLGSGEAVQIADTTNKFKQRYLELSNVEYVKELTDMIDAQRAYELATRVIRTQDEMAKDLNAIKS